jgi:iron complex transport system ATP-binding protein
MAPENHPSSNASAAFTTTGTGRITLEGMPLKNISIRQQARRISYVPQAEGRALPFTVFDYLLMGRYPHLSPFSTVTAEDRAMVNALLEQINMHPFAHRQLNTLSGGERQMIFIAAALAQQADILLLDEPTAFLDYQHKAAVDALLKQLNTEQQMTIINVSHDLNNACAQSTHILAIKNGTKHYHGSPADLLHPQKLESLYDTPFEIHQLNNGTRLATAGITS